MTAPELEPRPLTVERPGLELAGEVTGAGTPVVLCHGLTATRRYVLHGSRALVRAGFRTIAYDARGHGESDPAPAGSGYGYGALAEDLAAVVTETAGDDRVVLAGHSMGAHTVAAYALRAPDRVAGIVIIGPSFDGAQLSDSEAAYWDGLAEGLETAGVDGFMAAYEETVSGPWRDTVLRFTRERLERHRHPEAVAAALREVPRSRPFERLDDLEGLDLPALVVASHDDADPGHPYAVAEAWASRLPHGELISEEPGASPLAWQGGKLSREIAAFCERELVRDRLSG